MTARAPRAALVLVAVVIALSATPGCKRDERRRAAPPPTPSPVAGPAVGQKPPAARIAELEAELARNPKNVAGWVELGNINYDVRRREEAVKAYARALELQPDNLDVITDQGVMYRELGQLDKAAANFKRARELDPKHVQAAFNLGVVQAQLNQKDEAISSFETVTQLDPDGPLGDAARKLIESLKNPPPKAETKAGAKGPAAKP